MSSFSTQPSLRDYAQCRLSADEPTTSTPSVSLSVFRRLNVPLKGVIEPNLEPKVDSLGPRAVSAQ